MGISIHYTGRLKTKDSLPNLIEEVKDIAETYRWQYHIFEAQFPAGSFGNPTFTDDLYGICFTPPECEMVSLTFLSNGDLINSLAFQSHTIADEDMLKWTSVKTHYAGPAFHKVLIYLLDHLSNKYFRDFELSDEAQYWETRDEKLLDDNFIQLNALMASLGSALDAHPMKKGETFEVYFERLLHQIQMSRTKK